MRTIIAITIISAGATAAFLMLHINRKSRHSEFAALYEDNVCELSELFD